MKNRGQVSWITIRTVYFNPFLWSGYGFIRVYQSVYQEIVVYNIPEGDIADSDLWFNRMEIG